MLHRLNSIRRRQIAVSLRIGLMTVFHRASCILIRKSVSGKDNTSRMECSHSKVLGPFLPVIIRIVECCALSFTWIASAQAQRSQDERKVILVIWIMRRRLGSAVLVEISKWRLKTSFSLIKRCSNDIFIETRVEN